MVPPSRGIETVFSELLINVQVKMWTVHSHLSVEAAQLCREVGFRASPSSVQEVKGWGNNNNAVCMM